MAKIIITKQCSKCKQNKPISEYYKQLTGKDGYRAECKICFIRRIQQYHKTKQGHKVRSECNHRYKISSKGKQLHRKYYRDYPIKHKARSVVSNAVQTGKLPRPNSLQCHYCSNQAEQYHHWRGYEKKHWLDVIPACIPCHIS